MMGCSCGAGRREVNDAEFKRLGLMTCHAYSILDVRQVDNFRFLITFSFKKLCIKVLENPSVHKFRPKILQKILCIRVYAKNF